MSAPLYDSIGQSYSKFRLPDARIIKILLDLLRLDKGKVIADIGAGTGSYSQALADKGFFIRAVEPSLVMQKQAMKHPQVQWLRGYAENIPLPAASVDAVISLLASHHFSNLAKSLQEMDRIAGRGPIVILTFDPRLGQSLWIADYFPLIWEQAFAWFPPLRDIVALIQANTRRTVEVSSLMLPPDLTDLFAAAGWQRPEIYLNPEVRAGISAFALADVNIVAQGLKQLEADLNNGKWNAKYGAIRKIAEIDVGYRFLAARVTA
jgi:ubiquinone/menaquinone biosynthesis C-methylase UbiE